MAGALDPKVVSQTPAVLVWNFEEVKRLLEDHIEQYKDLVVNDQNLAEMEATGREIASLRVKLGKFKIAIKKEFEKPYGVFEVQFKQLAALVESAERPIADQIDKYEVLRKGEERIKLNNLIADVSAELGLKKEYSDQIVVDDKWLNRGAKIKEIKEAIQLRVCWFLDQQTQENERAEFRKQKLEMAAFMCNALSEGLINPLRVEEIENRVDSFDLAGLKAHISAEIEKRRSREDAVKKSVAEQAAKIEEVRVVKAEDIPPLKMSGRMIERQISPPQEDTLFDCEIKFQANMEICKKIKEFFGEIGVDYEAKSKKV